MELIGFGGKNIPISPKSTSTDAEYDGCIYGLRHLFDFLQTHFRESAIQSASSPDAKVLIMKDWDGMVTVRGDCKTVIDQMNGCSLPQKQRDKYLETIQCVQQIRQMMLSYQFDSPIHISFQHVTRDNNAFCDDLCNILLNEVQIDHLEKVVAMISTIKQVSSRINPSTLDVNGSKSWKKFYPRMSSPFQEPLHMISSLDDVKLPFKWRPWLLYEIALAAAHIDDTVALLLTGEVMVLEANQWKRFSSSREGEDNRIVKFRSLGMELQNFSLAKLGIRTKGIRMNDVDTFPVPDDFITSNESLFPLKSNDDFERSNHEEWYTLRLWCSEIRRGKCQQDRLEAWFSGYHRSSSTVHFKR